MKKFTLFCLLAILMVSVKVNAQSVLYSEPFTSNLGACTPTNGASGNWVWSNTCAMATAVGHTAPGSALFQGSGCQFGNGSSTVSGDLVTPPIVLSTVGNTLTFKYYLQNECGTGQTTCSYDVLKFSISNNNGASYTDIMSSSGSPAGLTNTSGWTNVSYNLSTYSGQTIRIKFNFNSIDGIGNTYDGVYVDDILVTGACSIAVVATSGGNTVIPALCSGNSLTLTTNAVSNYSWSTGATTNSIVVNPTSNASYSLTATSSSACVATAVINVSVTAAPPVLSVTSSTNNACLGQSVTLTASGALSYTWTGGAVNGVAFTPTTSGNYTVSGQNGCGITTAVVPLTVAPVAVSVLATPTIACASQAATLNATSSVTGYTWQPGNYIGGMAIVAPSVATVYTVTASNGTCIGTATINMPVNPVPTVNIAATTSVVCQGAPVTLTASGGSSYTWNPGNITGSVVTVNPTGPTLYSVAVSNNFNCITVNSQVVLTNPSPTLNIAVSDNLVCAGNSSTLSASGANSYLWDSGSTSSVVVVNPTATTVYTLVGASTNSCTSTQTVMVAAFQPSASITGNTVICLGKTASLTASGADTYTWSNGFQQPNVTLSPSSTSVYTLSSTTATGNINCDLTQTLQVTVNPNPTVQVVSTRSVICVKETQTITASGASTYSWTNGASTPTIVATSTAVTVLNLSVTGTDANGCEHTSGYQLKINSCTGLDENSKLSSLLIYPNPSNGQITINGGSKATLVLINQLGQVVKTIELSDANNHTATVSGLASGVYVISGLDGNQTVNQKIIVE